MNAATFMRWLDARNISLEAFADFNQAEPHLSDYLHTDGAHVGPAGRIALRETLLAYLDGNTSVSPLSPPTDPSFGINAIVLRDESDERIFHRQALTTFANFYGEVALEIVLKSFGALDRHPQIKAYAEVTAPSIVSRLVDFLTLARDRMPETIQQITELKRLLPDHSQDDLQGAAHFLRWMARNNRGLPDLKSKKLVKAELSAYYAHDGKTVPRPDRVKLRSVMQAVVPKLQADGAATLAATLAGTPPATPREPPLFTVDGLVARTIETVRPAFESLVGHLGERSLDDLVVGFRPIKQDRAVQATTSQFDRGTGNALVKTLEDCRSELPSQKEQVARVTNALKDEDSAYRKPERIDHTAGFLRWADRKNLDVTKLSVEERETYMKFYASTILKSPSATLIRTTLAIMDAQQPPPAPPAPP